METVGWAGNVFLVIFHLGDMVNGLPTDDEGGQHLNWCLVLLLSFNA